MALISPNDYQRKYAEKHRERKREYDRLRRGLPRPTRPRPELCECCQRAPTYHGLCIDHNHETGKFRGWLCGFCNRGIGQLGDNAAGLQQAQDYLNRSA